jgi:beta-xylosidase
MNLKTNFPLVAAFCMLCAVPPAFSQRTDKNASMPDAGLSKVWVADNGDGTYKNPILYADYSDPDVIRWGGDFYMVTSSFQCAPGLPILHSRDLVNWSLIGHAFEKQVPVDAYNAPRPGCGAWAPAIRRHDGEFFIYYPDPDYGIYLVKAKNPAGPWSDPVLIKKVRGWIDPCPLWDDDGAYLVHAMAGSRSGIKSILAVSRMSPDGSRVLDDGVIVFDGHANHPTVEGPKFYKRNGYYYIFAPAGGVPTGWQLVLRSRKVYGPYEERIVLSQGRTEINGPHQGAWIDTPKGEDWFIHFQDKGAYGRIVHLQPMRWKDDWPVMGVDEDGDGRGEPVLQHKKPDVGAVYPKSTPPESDEFNADAPGLQWQWQANSQTNWMFPSPAYGMIRLFNLPLPEGTKNLFDVPNLLLQKFPAPVFTATAKVVFTPRAEGERTGLVVLGLDYATLSVIQKPGGLFVVPTVCRDADRQGPETEGAPQPVKSGPLYLRVTVSEHAQCRFSFSEDGNRFTPIGEAFPAREGKWIGAKVGIFAVRTGTANESGYADFDWFRIE